MKEKEKDIDYCFKIVLCGSSNVGKTKLIERFAKNKFEEHSRATVGVDFFNHDINIDG